MKLIKILALVIILASCTPQKRLNRLLRNNPSLIKRDTIFRIDTIITVESAKDTAFYFYQKDTVFIRDGKMTVKYVINKDSTVFIRGECAPDTIIREVPIVVNDTTHTEYITKKWNRWLLYGLISIIIFLIIERIIRR